MSYHIRIHTYNALRIFPLTLSFSHYAFVSSRTCICHQHDTFIPISSGCVFRMNEWMNESQDGTHTHAHTYTMRKRAANVRLTCEQQRWLIIKMWGDTYSGKVISFVHLVKKINNRVYEWHGTRLNTTWYDQTYEKRLHFIICALSSHKVTAGVLLPSLLILFFAFNAT